LYERRCFCGASETVVKISMQPIVQVLLFAAGKVFVTPNAGGVFSAGFGQRMATKHIWRPGTCLHELAFGNADR
jgi:hypothetical protein